MAASTPENGLRLLLVYVEGGNPEDYTFCNVRGKVALVDGTAKPTKVGAAEQAGVAACIFANWNDPPHEMIVSGVWGFLMPNARERLLAFQLYR